MGRFDVIIFSPSSFGINHFKKLADYLKKKMEKLLLKPLKNSIK
jgi:hypothetical protein